MKTRDVPVALVLVAAVGAAALGMLGTVRDRGEVGSPLRRAPAGHVATPHATFDFDAARGAIEVKSDDGRVDVVADLSIVVDGVPRRAALPEGRRAPIGAAVPIPIVVGGAEVTAAVALFGDAADDAMAIDVAVPAGAGAHTIALRVSLPTATRGAFVSGAGEVADVNPVTGHAAVVAPPVVAPPDAAGPPSGAPPSPAPPDERPLGIASPQGAVEVVVGSVEGTDPGAAVDAGGGEPIAPRVAVTGPATSIGHDGAHAGLRFVLGATPAATWRGLFRLAGEKTAHVHGVVRGTRDRAWISGLDDAGAPRVWTIADAGGRFDLDVPPSVTRWYAAVDVASAPGVAGGPQTSAPVRFVPGAPFELALDVSPGGNLRVRVVDADTGTPLTARLVVHGIDGTLDPNFGPDYRASGAGPLVDALRGDVDTPLPAGRYRIAATRGIEWSVDAKVVDVAPGHAVAITLAPRHVVQTPGVVGCDLHVHARPSFDTPVAVEDRVLSLVAAGVDFAVPTEHNIVGDYRPSLDALDLARDLATVSGVEVTTYSPRFGHFGVFPYPPGHVPPYRATTIGAVMTAARRDDPGRVVVLHHPRLPQAIGYFDVVHFDPAKRAPYGMRTDFDAIEVYNGYDLGRPQRVDAVMRDWFALLDRGLRTAATGSSDSHRIQYQWAGYPRTLVTVGEDAAGDRAGTAIDPLAVVAAIRGGRSVVTSGPIVDLAVNGRGPGETVELAGDAATASVHVRVRAAPWIDVRTLEVVVAGKTVTTVPIAPRPTTLGPEEGTADEAAARTVRYEADLVVPLADLPPLPAGSPPRPPEAARRTYLLAIARGERPMDDVLPFMPVAPLGFTNPVWVVRR